MYLKKKCELKKNLILGEQSCAYKKDMAIAIWLSFFKYTSKKDNVFFPCHRHLTAPTILARQPRGKFACI